MQDAYGGPTSPLFVDDFVNYTATVASALGSKVQYWSTFNEGQSFCPLGYGEGTFAPGQLVGHYKCCMSRPGVVAAITVRIDVPDSVPPCTCRHRQQICPVPVHSLHSPGARRCLSQAARDHSWGSGLHELQL